jgi:TonB family protein
MEPSNQVPLRHKCCLLACAVVAILLWSARESMAQVIQSPAGPASAAQATLPDGAPSESARRQALSPFRFILRNAESPQKPKKKELSKASPSSTEALLHRPGDTNPSSSPGMEAATFPRSQSPDGAATATTARRSDEPIKVLTPAPVAKPLIPIAQDPPVLTAALQREVSSGKVTVAFEIRPDGNTGDIRVVSSSNRRLNSAVTAAIAKWRFQPIDDARLVEVDFSFEEP